MTASTDKNSGEIQDGSVAPPPLDAVPIVASASEVVENVKTKPQIIVSKKDGNMCSILAKAQFPAPPHVIFGIYTLPDNSGAFRDVKKVGQTKVLEEAPGWRVVEREHQSELSILWRRRTYSTSLVVEEDSRDPDCLTTNFKLVKSDIMNKMHGKWTFKPVKDQYGQVVATDATLEQDIHLKHVPSFVMSAPLFGRLMKSISAGNVSRQLEDINNVADRWTPGADLQMIITQMGSETDEER